MLHFLMKAISDSWDNNATLSKELKTDLGQT